MTGGDAGLGCGPQPGLVLGAWAGPRPPGVIAADDVAGGWPAVAGACAGALDCVIEVVPEGPGVLFLSPLAHAAKDPAVTIAAAQVAKRATNRTLR